MTDGIGSLWARPQLFLNHPERRRYYANPRSTNGPHIADCTKTLCLFQLGIWVVTREIVLEMERVLCKGNVGLLQRTRAMQRVYGGSGSNALDSRAF